MIVTTRPAALLIAALTASLTLLIVSGTEQIADPFLRNNDFPAYFRDADTYLPKTLQEGRWVNYWWHLRPFPSPAWVNYLLFIFGSSFFAAALSVHALKSAPLWLTALTASLVALAPQSILMAGWFNTLIPGIWIVAVYGVLTLAISPDRSRLMLFLFVPLTLLAYSTYPLLLLLVCLVRHDEWSTWSSFALTVVTFVAAFALGITTMYGMNWAVHGVFGLEYVDWRSATPAASVTELAANLPMVWDFYTWMFSGLGFARTWFAILNVLAFAAAVAVIARHDKVRAAALVTGALLGLVMLTALTLKDGVHIFFRATQFTWAAYVVALAEALIRLQAEGNARAYLAAVVFCLVLAVSLVFSAEVFRTLSPFQAETRRIAALVPKGSKEIQVFGDYEAIPEVRTAHIQHETGLTYRLEALTGIPTVYCSTSPGACAVPAPPARQAAGNAIRVEARDGIAFVMLPNS